MKHKKFLPLLALSTAQFFVACGNDTAATAEKAEEAVIARSALGPAESIQAIFSDLADGKGTTLWTSMPASYQKDITEIVKLAGSKADEELYDQTMAFLGRFSSLAEKKVEFIANTELAGSQPEEEREKARKNIPAIAAIVKSLTSSSIGSVEGLKTFDGMTFATETVSEFLKYGDQIASLNGSEYTLSDLKKAKVNLVSLNEDKAELELVGLDSESEKADFVKVEGKWVPEEMAEKWDESIAEARSSIEAYDPSEHEDTKAQLLVFFSSMDSVFDNIEAAEDQKSFDQAVQGAMLPVMGLGMTLQKNFSESVEDLEDIEAVEELEDALEDLE